MKVFRTFAVILVALAFSAASFAQAKPQAAGKPGTPAVKAADDPAAKLPKPVLDAFKKAYPSAVIKTASKETEAGKTTWEVESTDNGLARDLVYNPDGTVVSIEEEIAAAGLPAPVAAAFKAKYPKASITKAEKLTEGKTLTYELTISGAGSVKSAEFTPEGKLVPAKAEKDEKEDDAKPAPKKK